MKNTTVAVLVCAVALDSAACRRSSPTPHGTIAPLDVAAPPPEAMTTASGLAYRVLASGPGGRHPGSQARVVIHYTGWTPQGVIIEGAPPGDPPATFQLSDTMPGWREGLRMMSAGDKWRFWIPGPLAYGEEPGKPHGMVVYDIELVEFVD